MLLALVSATIFGFSSLVSAHHCNKLKCCGPLESGSITPLVPVNKNLDTAIGIGEDWQRFFFGANETWAKPSQSSSAFYLATLVPVVLRMTDAFVSGDQFALYLNGSLIGNTSVPVVNSSFYTEDPNEAFINANYSSGSWILPKGLHRLTIEVLASQNTFIGSSSAYIRADVNPAVKCGKCRPHCKAAGPCTCLPRPSLFNPPGCCANSGPFLPPFGPMCQEATGRYLMIKRGMTRDEGVQACRRMNMHLAAITSDNFVGLNEFAFLCNNQQTVNNWVRSWNGDSYGGTCLVMQSALGGNDAITAGDCDELESVLCEV